MATLRALYDALKDAAVFGDYYTRHHTPAGKEDCGIEAANDEPRPHCRTGRKCLPFGRVRRYAHIAPAQFAHHAELVAKLMKSTALAST